MEATDVNSNCSGDSSVGSRNSESNKKDALENDKSNESKSLEDEDDEFMDDDDDDPDSSSSKILTAVDGSEKDESVNDNELVEKSKKRGRSKDSVSPSFSFSVDNSANELVNDDVTSSSTATNSSKKADVEDEDEKMDTDSETISSTESEKVAQSNVEVAPIDICNSNETEEKDSHEEGSAKPDDVPKSVKKDLSKSKQKQNGDATSSESEAKPSSSEVLNDSQKSEEAMEVDEVKTGSSSKDIGGKKVVRNASKCDGVKENGEKVSVKERSLGIDAIAKKLGLQMKVNEDNKAEKEGNTSTDSDKVNHVADSSTEQKAKETSKSSSKTKGEGTEKKKSKKKVCEECGATKGLKFQVVNQGKIRFLCSDFCFKNFKLKQNLEEQQQQQQKKPEPSPEPKEEPPPPEKCAQCRRTLKPDKGYYPLVGEAKPLCSEDCLMNYQEANTPKKKCAQCKVNIEDESVCLTWETMDFCNEDCLGKYQSYLGSHCTCCQTPVQQTCLGKYCVCFGADIRQFCSGTCLEEFKKGLKVCSFCQKDLSTGSEGFLAPVGEKGQFKDFCGQQCMERYETMNNRDNSTTPTQCSFCNKMGTFRIQPDHDGSPVVLCGDTCVAGYRYLHKIKKKLCDTCFAFFEPDSELEFRFHYEGVVKYYCSKACMTLFALSHRKIVPCSWCKVKKYNFDMIEKLDSSHQVQTYCSLNCISMYRVSLNATSAKSIRCDNCSKTTPAQYHLTMSDGSIRNFCSYQCVVQFQNQFTNNSAALASAASRQTPPTPSSPSPAVVPPPPPPPPPSPKTTASSHTPVISSVRSLAGATQRPQTTILTPKLVAAPKVAVPQQAGQAISIFAAAKAPSQSISVSTPTTTATVATRNTAPTQVIREVLIRPAQPKPVKNKAVLCKPIMQTKGISCKPHPCHKAVQTDDAPTPAIVPIPIPIYVPTPVHMFSRPVPCPVPFPVPIPVPILLPTTKESPGQILKHLKDIQDKLPSDPLEGEMLLMAEKAAGDKKSGSNSEERFEKEGASEMPNIPESEENFDTPLDVENEMPPGIAPVLSKEVTADGDEDYVPKEGRSHGKRSSRSKGVSKRAKVERVEIINAEDSDSLSSMPLLEEHSPSQPAQDTNLRLKLTFGVNAWKHWVLQKNSQLEKGSQSSKKFKPIKTDLLQLPPDELNSSLSKFVKEVRKPSGEEYAPASIYYLCLGIQQYLFQNGRIDNIFTDTYYDTFTEQLHDVLLSQDELLPVEGFFISRIEEEVLWESKQLGAHSPHVLLNTLMFFNTKYFNLKTIDEHLHLSFSHITKHWRKTSLKAGPRNVVLRYYPPTNKDWQRRRKEENGVYEQTENLENPLRCPVKLYEFYLSKCPESVKTRNDVFYLLPERSCVPDSPVWYSTQAMAREMIARMLQRIKTIREVHEN